MIVIQKSLRTDQICNECHRNLNGRKQLETLKKAMTIGAERHPYFDPRSMLLRAEGVNIIIHNDHILKYVLIC